MKKYKTKFAEVLAAKWGRHGDHHKVLKGYPSDRICLNCHFSPDDHGFFEGSSLIVCPHSWIVNHEGDYYVYSDREFLEKFEPMPVDVSKPYVLDLALSSASEKFRFETKEELNSFLDKVKKVFPEIRHFASIDIDCLSSKV